MGRGDTLHLMRRVWLAKYAVALLALLSASASAGTLYRCEGSGGVVSYSGQRTPGAVCKAIHYAGGGASRRGSPAAFSPSSRAATVGAPLAADLPESAMLSTARPVQTIASVTSPTSGAPVSKVGSAARVEFRTAPTIAELTPSKPNGNARVTRGAVYKFTNRDGVTNYTNVRPAGSVGAAVLFTYIETCFACGSRPGVNFSTLTLNTQAFANEIALASRNYGVDESLIRAIIHAESAFNPNALSYKGAQGLMQLMPGTARRFGVANAFQAAANISGGVQYLAFLSKRFNGDVRLIAAAYNAGEGAVDRYGGVPPYAETQVYVQRVDMLAQRYRANTP